METVEVLKVTAIILALAIAIIGHEIMHGWVAYKYGDNTAKNQGRLSINPIVHLDPIGSIAVPALLYFSGAPLLFGWAKPVPVYMPTVLKNGGTNGAVAVALAGITYNISLAGIFAAILPMLIEPQSMTEAFFTMFVVQSIIINVLLAVFNLIPVPPLDGANAVRYLALGWKWDSIVKFYDKIYPYGMIVIIIILVTPIKDFIFTPVSWIIKFLI
ncbi:MAG: site-2 protease family protein [Sulfurovum sp.]|nr:site-2 protease family protein [Sulfurovaceae bacterium]